MTARKSNKASAPSGGLAASDTWIVLETVLLVGLGKEALEWLVLERAPLPPVVQVLLGMAVVTGTLGGLLVLAEQRIRRGIGRTHRKVQRRYRLPALLVHMVVMIGIFLAYAAFWNQETGALNAMIDTGARWWAQLVERYG